MKKFCFLFSRVFVGQRYTNRLTQKPSDKNYSVSKQKLFTPLLKFINEFFTRKLTRMKDLKIITPIIEESFVSIQKLQKIWNKSIICCFLEIK